MFLKLWGTVLWAYAGISALHASRQHEDAVKWFVSMLAGTALLAAAVAVWL